MTTHELLLAAKAACPGTWPGWAAKKRTRPFCAWPTPSSAKQTSSSPRTQADVQAAQGIISDVMLDRLRLTQARIAAMADGMRQVCAAARPGRRGAG